MSAHVDVLAVLDARIALNLERGTKGGGYVKGSPRHREDLAVRDAVAELLAKGTDVAQGGSNYPHEGYPAELVHRDDMDALRAALAACGVKS